MEWYSGLDNYRKHTLDFGPTENTFTVEIQDSDLKFNNIEECFLAHLSEARYPIEVLYSGGLDSEFIIAVCKKLKLPVVAATLRLMSKGAPINTHDLYYAEKFCSKTDTKLNLVDLDIDSFYDNGDHFSYLDPYKITNGTVAAIMYLINQCHSFPVYGGDYSWPLTNIGIAAYSPHRYEFNCYDHYLNSRGGGIGNMLGYTLCANKLLISEHLSAYEDKNTFKYKIFNQLGYDLECRHKFNGWETTTILKPDITTIAGDLLSRYGKTKNIIKWNKSMGQLLGNGIGSGEWSDYSLLGGLPVNVPTLPKHDLLTHT